MTSDQPSEQAAHHDRNPILTLIALFKFVKATTLIAVGLGALQLIRPSVREQAQTVFEGLGSAVDVVPVLRLLRNIGALPAGKLRLVGLGAFVYAALFLTEGIGLWRQRRWAEYFTLIATASFIPFEVFELAKRVTLPRGGALLINIGVLIYLVVLLRRGSRWGLS